VTTRAAACATSASTACFKDGHYYLVARISREDAEARGIRDDDLIRLWNHRGSVVCAAQVTRPAAPGAW
jgi:anaerobic selenocysteine-containing dehydrogenase